MWLISWDGLIFELDDRFQCLCVCMWKSEREQKRKQYLVQSLINWHTQKWILFIAYNLFDVFIHTFENLCENVWVVIYISRQFFFFLRLYIFLWLHLYVGVLSMFPHNTECNTYSFIWVTSENVFHTSLLDKRHQIYIFP